MNIFIEVFNKKFCVKSFFLLKSKRKLFQILSKTFHKQNVWQNSFDLGQLEFLEVVGNKAPG